jgi:hypothetical protein
MKTAMILTALAGLAISGNAMALNTAAPRGILVDGAATGGSLLFSPNTTNVAPAGGVDLFGSCRYHAAWYLGAAGVGTALACQIDERKSATALSCNANRKADFFSASVTAATATCSGFNENGEPFSVALGTGGVAMAMTEFPAPIGVIGSVTFDGLLPQAIQF